MTEVDRMAESLSLHFEGPFSWTGERAPALTDSSLATTAGLYLWAVQTRLGGLVQYVGETGRTFGERFEEHLRAQLAGEYSVHDVAALRNGRRDAPLWPGVYGPDRPRTVRAFAARLSELAAPQQEYIRMVRFYLGSAELPDRVRRRVEAAIAGHLAAQAEPVGTFLDPDVRYQPRLPSEQPIEIRLSASSSLRGFPDSVVA